MKSRWWMFIPAGMAAAVFLAAVFVLAVVRPGDTKREQRVAGGARVELPAPRRTGPVSVEESLRRRRSVRDYAGGSLALSEVGQLLWAAQGVTDERTGGRTAPSAGALYPLEVYLVAGKVNGLPAGVYHYRPAEHSLTGISRGDARDSLCRAALSQSPVRQAPACLVITGIYERTAMKYGDRAERYVHMEAGHAAQNLYLQATALDLGIVVIGAFDDARVKEVVGMARGAQPLYVVPVGRAP